MKVKNILCYLALAFLLALIIMPPVLRLTYNEEEEEVKDTVISLSCSDDDKRMINVTYKNDNIYMFRYIITKTYDSDDVLEEVTDDSLKNSLENVTNVEVNDTSDEYNYTVFFDENGYNDNNFPSEYMQDSISEESFLTNQGYSCTTFEQ